MKITDTETIEAGKYLFAKVYTDAGMYNTGRKLLLHSSACFHAIFHILSIISQGFSLYVPSANP